MMRRVLRMGRHRPIRPRGGGTTEQPSENTPIQATKQRPRTPLREAAGILQSIQLEMKLQKLILSEITINTSWMAKAKQKQTNKQTHNTCNRFSPKPAKRQEPMNICMCIYIYIIIYSRRIAETPQIHAMLIKLRRYSTNTRAMPWVVWTLHGTLEYAGSSLAVTAEN